MQKIATSSLLEKALSVSSLRQQLLANNIANIDTPAYKRFDVAMKSALEKFDQPPGQAVYQQTHTSLRLDGNNVDIETEMAYVAETEAYFNALASSLIKQMSTLRYLISEGRR